MSLWKGSVIELGRFFVDFWKMVGSLWDYLCSILYYCSLYLYRSMGESCVQWVSGSAGRGLRWADGGSSQRSSLAIIRRCDDINAIPAHGKKKEYKQP